MAPCILEQDQCLLVNSNNALLCRYCWQNFCTYEALPYQLEQFLGQSVSDLFWRRQSREDSSSVKPSTKPLCRVARTPAAFENPKTITQWNRAVAQLFLWTPLVGRAAVDALCCSRVRSLRDKRCLRSVGFPSSSTLTNELQYHQPPSPSPSPSPPPRHGICQMFYTSKTPNSSNVT